MGDEKITQAAITVEEWLESGTVEIGSMFFSADSREKYEVVKIDEKRKELHVAIFRIRKTLKRIGSLITYYKDYRVIPIVIVPHG